MERIIRRLRAGDRSELLADGLLALALTVYGQLNLRFDLDGSTHYGLGFAAAAMTAAATGVIALRRRAPLLTVCVVAAAVAGPELVTRLTITLWGSLVPLLIALYSVARHARYRAALAGAVVTALAVAVIMLRVPVIGTVANIPFTIVPCAVAFAAGRVLRSRQNRHIEDSERVRELESGRDETVRAAIADERDRIARELHDIVATASASWWFRLAPPKTFSGGIRRWPSRRCGRSRTPDARRWPSSAACSACSAASEPSSR